MVFQMPCSISLGFSGTLTGGLILVVWQVVHSLIYAFTNVVIPGHQKSLISFLFSWMSHKFIMILLYDFAFEILIIWYVDQSFVEDESVL
jgi:hypothetical protein